VALVLADRVKETSTTTGTGTYTLAGAVSGFESFGSIGNGNTTYYACTLGADFEVGIGTYASSGTTLARTTILQSSNSDNAVDWGSGTKTLFCTQPAEKAVFRDASGHIIALDGRNLTNVDAATLDSVDSTSFLRSDAADTKTSGNLTFNDNIKALFGTSSDLQIFHNGSNSIIYDGGTGELQLQTDGTSIKLLKANTNEILANFIPDGSSQLYYDASKKLETSSTGATVTGGLTANVTGDGTEVLRLGTERPWSFLQRNTGASSSLSFRSTVDGKFFDIEAEDGDLLARFIANNTTGLVALYYGGSQRFITTSEGAQINSNLLITSTSSGSGEDPTLDLYRNSSSPAVNDILGHIVFSGENDAGEKITYGEIESLITDETDGTENGIIKFNAIHDGSAFTFFTIGYNATFFYKNVALHTGANITFEGATSNAYETTLTATDPTADRTITLPNASGTVQVTSSSDRRLKKNIEPASSASQKIDDINVYQFDWIENNKHVDFGVVAQEMQEVFPDCVAVQDPETGYLGIDYSKLVPVLLQEIKDLRARVADLENK
jgi:hypothetical protein